MARSMVLPIMWVCLTGAGLNAADMPAANSLTEAETREGWRLLWDGRTAEGWRGIFLDAFPKDGWRIENGELSVLSRSESPARGGDIVTTGVFTNFELKLEFRLTPGANSGIKYYVYPDFVRAQKSAIACEFQVLDDSRHPDAGLGRSGTRTTGALYDVLAPAADKPVRPVGEWNEARIVARWPRVEHWLNGRKILEFDRSSGGFRKQAAGSKFKKFPEWGTWKYGHILLQDHGDHVSYRNIKARVLND